MSPLVERVRGATSAVIELAWPKRCSGCGLRGTWLCEDCLDREPVWTTPWCARCGVPSGFRCHCDELAPAISSARALGQHNGWIQQGVHLLKYRDELARAEQFAPMLAQAVADVHPPDVIVPVPLHRTRELERGYNQARLLATSLSASSGIPVVDAGAFVRSVDTPHQTGLPSAQRRRNLAGAFSVRASDAFSGKRVLLVDDVMTSGSTVAECARTLRSGGACSVAIVTVSRALSTAD